MGLKNKYQPALNSSSNLLYSVLTNYSVIVDAVFPSTRQLVHVLGWVNSY